MRKSGDTRCGAMRRKGSAATSASQKNLILPQDNSRETRCLRFAARLVGRVNVRDLRESQIEVKCFPRCRISRRTMCRCSCVSRSNTAQAIERAFEFLWAHRRLRAQPLQALPSTRFSASNDALRRCKTPSIATVPPQRAQGLPQDFACSRVISRCALSTSTNAGFRLDPVAVS